LLRNVTQASGIWVPRTTFGTRREGVAGGWRRLHSEELNNLYASANIMRLNRTKRTRWAGHVARMREIRNAYKILVKKPERKKLLGRPWCRWDTIRIRSKKIRWEGEDCIHVAQNRDQWPGLVNTVMNLRVP